VRGADGRRWVSPNAKLCVFWKNFYDDYPHASRVAENQNACNARTCVLLTVLSMNLFRFLLGKARLSYLLPYYRHVNIFKSRVACIVRSVLP